MNYDFFILNYIVKNITERRLLTKAWYGNIIITPWFKEDE